MTRPALKPATRRKIGRLLLQGLDVPEIAARCMVGYQTVAAIAETLHAPESTSAAESTVTNAEVPAEAVGETAEPVASAAPVDSDPLETPAAAAPVADHCPDDGNMVAARLVRADGWPPELDAELRRLWPERTARELSALLGRSRSAVIARARRLDLQRKGLQRTPRSVAGPTARERRKQVQVSLERARTATRLSAPEPVPAPVAPLLDPDEPWVPPPSPPRGQCHWIDGAPGSPPWSWCGAPVEPGRPYCPHHCGRAYRQAPALSASVPA